MTEATTDTPGPRAFWHGSALALLEADPQAVVGQLASRHVRSHSAAEAEQVRAWEREIEILRLALAACGERARAWGVLLESPMLRLGKRMDAVILLPGAAAVLEFKIGARRIEAADRGQVERYALLLRDFHEVSQSLIVVPVLCAEHADTYPSLDITVPVQEGVAEIIATGAGGLADALRIAEALGAGRAVVSVESFDASAYRPTPTIVEAARALYAGHGIAEIGRGDAADAALQHAGATLLSLAERAERDRLHLICFVTGSPGAGKTLLGLDAALRNRSSARPAALLSGNRPLVHVLTEALATDRASRGEITKAQARHEIGASIQNLLGFLKEHADGAPPPERVIVFDEAQRAWDEKVGEELMGRPSSEPTLFLDILGRLDWACLICLVGPGQEINRGEGGLPLWGAALQRSADDGRPWNVVAAPQAIAGGPDVAGPGLVALGAEVAGKLLVEPSLHLSNGLRAYRSPDQGRWVASLLAGEIDKAARIASTMRAPPALLTRDLACARQWLRDRRRGGRSVGLLASSGAVRLTAEGLPPTPRSNELDVIGHWFLKPWMDFRSAGALEVPLSEFGCQGLELDFAGITWGGDLAWTSEGWTPRRMSAPKWVKIGAENRRSFRINAYRVLLTRARAGLVIYVPKGNTEDASRDPLEFDEIAAVLTRAGSAMLHSASHGTPAEER